MSPDMHLCSSEHSRQADSLMRFSLPRSWMVALDFSLGAAGGAGLASMHEPVGSDGGPSACQRVLAAFGTILEPYDPHRRLVHLHTRCCRDM